MRTRTAGVLFSLLLVGCKAAPPASSQTEGESSSGSADATTSSGGSSSSGTDTGETSTSSTDTGESTSTEGCADAGNEPPDERPRHAQQPPDYLPQPLPIPPDLGMVPGCDVFAQDCPEGEKCVPYASTGNMWDAVKCVLVLGDGMIGDACMSTGMLEATDDCGVDSACWLVDEQGMGVCTGFCSGSAQAPQCPQGQYCLQLFGVTAYCVDGCNPLTQECPEGQACMWTGEGFACTLTGAKFPAGEICGDYDDCGISLICVPAAALPNCGGANCCAEFCDLDCPDACSEVGTSCQPFYAPGEAPPGHEDVGVCVGP